MCLLLFLGAKTVSRLSTQHSEYEWLIISGVRDGLVSRLTLRLVSKS